MCGLGLKSKASPNPSEGGELWFVKNFIVLALSTFIFFHSNNPEVINPGLLFLIYHPSSEHSFSPPWEGLGEASSVPPLGEREGGFTKKEG
jgi:hypothetical protein